MSFFHRSSEVETPGRGFWQNLLMGVLAVARKSCGGPLPIFGFYWIFMTKFLEKNLGVHGVPPSPFNY
jgi:hypothetical protein